MAAQRDMELLQHRERFVRHAKNVEKRRGGPPKAWLYAVQQINGSSSSSSSSLPSPSSATPCVPDGDIFLEHELQSAAAAGGGGSSSGGSGSRCHVGEVVNFLLNKCHVYVDAGDGLGRTPLMLATMVKHKPAVLALLKGGARLSATDQLGNTPLHYAYAFGALDVLPLFLAAGADPTLQTSRQAMMTDRIYKERFFPHELLADANGAPDGGKEQAFHMKRVKLFTEQLVEANHHHQLLEVLLLERVRRLRGFRAELQVLVQLRCLCVHGSDRLRSGRRAFALLRRAYPPDELPLLEELHHLVPPRNLLLC